MSATTLAAVAVVVAIVNPASADLISVTASGYMTDSTYSGVSAGDTFDFYISYDDTASDQVPADPNAAQYLALSASLHINSSPFLTFHQYAVIIRENEPHYNDVWQAAGVLTSPNTIQALMSIWDTSGQAHSGDALVLPSMANYPDGAILVLDNITLGQTADGVVTSITVSTIPEPGTLTTLLLGGAGLFCLRRRRAGRIG
jgi:hypothetical protein